LNRFEELLKRQSVSQQEFDEVQARYTASQAEMQRAREMLAVAESKRAQIEARITQAKVNLENAELYSSYFKIDAPYSGIVISKTSEVGQLASPGVPLLTIENPSGYRLEAQVEESRIHSISPGDPVSVRIDAINQEVKGTVDQILPVADPASRSVTVRVTLPGAEGIRSGMFGIAQFRGRERTVMTVPNNALVRRGQLIGIFVVDEDSRARFRLIKPGRNLGDRTEVLSGLKDGDRFVVSPDHQISDGRQVRSQTAEIREDSKPVHRAGVNS
jgi:RND family efflux transporter MFP subunit